MKIKNNDMKKIICGLLVLTSCVGCFSNENAKKEPKKEYKYTIWVGSPAFGVGHGTDTFNIENEMMNYIDSDADILSHLKVVRFFSLRTS